MNYWLKKIFKKKQLVEVQEVSPVEDISTDIQEQPEEHLEETGKYCELCKEPIYTDERWTKPRGLGKIYHDKCWKEMVKAVW